DGDLDALVNNNGQEPQLLLNEGANSNHWLEIALVGTRSNRDGVGARVKVTAGGPVFFWPRQRGRGYEASPRPPAPSSLWVGGRDKVDLIEIRWPSGSVDILKNIEANRIVTIKEGMR